MCDIVKFYFYDETYRGDQATKAKGNHQVVYTNICFFFSLLLKRKFYSHMVSIDVSVILFIDEKRILYIHELTMKSVDEENEKGILG
jgi:hypothetical protein